MTIDASALQIAFELTQSPSESFDLEDGREVIVTRDGYRTEIIEKKQSLLEHPTRRKGTIEAADLVSFIEIWGDYANEQTRVYGQQREKLSALMGFRAVFDDNHGQTAGHQDFTTSYTPELSEPWRIWMGLHDRYVGQTLLAEVIEEQGRFIDQPSNADMLELTRTFEATTNASFKSGVRLANGAKQLSYISDVEASAAGGTIEIPEAIHLTIPVFVDPAFSNIRAEVEASFMYRIKEGNLVMKIAFRDLETVMFNTRKQLVDAVQSQFPKGASNIRMITNF